MKHCAQCKAPYKPCKTESGCPKCAPNTSISEEEFVKPIKVHGWVWKKKSNDDTYNPSYTPAQHIPRDELYALVDPKDLINPLENTDWFSNDTL